MSNDMFEEIFHEVTNTFGIKVERNDELGGGHRAFFATTPHGWYDVVCSDEVLAAYPNDLDSPHEWLDAAEYHEFAENDAPLERASWFVNMLAAYRLREQGESEAARLLGFIYHEEVDMPCISLDYIVAFGEFYNPKKGLDVLVKAELIDEVTSRVDDKTYCSYTLTKQAGGGVATFLGSHREEDKESV